MAPAVAMPANMSSTICVGTRIEIIGLQKRPDLNGVVGTCVGYDQTEQRWYVEVLVGESMKRFRLKTNNLTAPASGSHVHLNCDYQTFMIINFKEQ